MGYRNTRMSIRDSEPILAGLADAIVASDEGGLVIYANQAAEKLLGWSRAELLGMPLSGLMPPRMHAMHEAGFRRSLETHRPRIFGRPVRVPARRRDGEELDVELTSRRSGKAARRSSSPRCAISATASSWSGRSSPSSALLRRAPPSATGCAPPSLSVREKLAGVVEFFQRLPQAVDEELLQSAATLGGQIGQCLERIEAQVEQRAATEAAHPARIEAQTVAKQASFLAEAGAALASSLDLAETLRRVAGLAVPTIADWCTVAALDEEGTLRRVAVVHADPGKRELVAEYGARFPPERHRAGTFLGVLAQGKSILQPVVTDADLRAAAQSEEHLHILRGLGCTSCVMVPMQVRGQPVGVISLMRGTGSPEFEPRDLRVVEELARRAVLAISI